jgi:hypothetical protein
LTAFSLLSFQPLHVSIRPFAASADAATTSSLRAVAVFLGGSDARTIVYESVAFWASGARASIALLVKRAVCNLM